MIAHSGLWRQGESKGQNFPELFRDNIQMIAALTFAAENKIGAAFAPDEIGNCPTVHREEQVAPPTIIAEEMQL